MSVVGQVPRLYSTTAGGCAAQISTHRTSPLRLYVARIAFTDFRTTRIIGFTAITGQDRRRPGHESQSVLPGETSIFEVPFTLSAYLYVNEICLITASPAEEGH